MSERERGGGTPMPDDPQASPRQTVDALEEKVSGSGAQREQEQDQEPEQDAAAIDPDEHDPGAMHRSTEPPA